MFEDSEIINDLNQELSLGEKFANINPDDVYDAFEKYVSNKDFLKELIAAGGFYYDYQKYKSFYKDSIFEDGISEFIGLYQKAFTINPVLCDKVFKDNYDAILLGTASQMQIARLFEHGPSRKRLDVYVKYLFQSMSELIEGTLKPYLLFLDQLRAVSKGRQPTVNKLGVAVQNLCDFSPIFKGIYQEMLFQRKVSDWRNVGKHNRYIYKDNDHIEISFGEGTNTVCEVYSIELIEILFITVDTIVYMHKTANSLLHLDLKQKAFELHLKFEKNKESEKDDWTCAIVELACAKGFSVLKLDWDTNILILRDWTKPVKREQLIEFLDYTQRFLGDEFEYIFVGEDKIDYLAKKYDGVFSILPCSYENSSIILMHENIKL